MSEKSLPCKDSLETAVSIAMVWKNKKLVKVTVGLHSYNGTVRRIDYKYFTMIGVNRRFYYNEISGIEAL